MKRILSLLAALALLIGLASAPAFAAGETHSDASENFIQTFSGNYQNGDKLTSLDFVYFHDGAVHNALDECEDNVLYFCPDAEDAAANAGLFTTMRGVQLFASGGDVQTCYGYRTPRAYDPAGDSVYSAMKDAGDENCSHLEGCTRFVVYTFDDKAQIAFYFDGEDTLRFCAYTKTLLYRDSDPMRTLRYGSITDDVKVMQTRLMELGYFTDVVDGRFGEFTEGAVRAFQEAHCLEADGIATPKVQQMIYSPEALKYAAPTETPAAEADPEEEALMELEDPVMTLAPMMVITPTPPPPTPPPSPTPPPPQAYLHMRDRP